MKPMQALLLPVAMLCWSSMSYAEVWGIERSCYRKADVQASDDTRFKKGSLDITFVIEVRGVEESFWLTVKYGESKEEKIYIYASRLWDEGSPFKLFSLDGYPVGSGSLSDEAGESIVYEYNIRLADKRIKITRVSDESSTSESLSAVMTVDGDEIAWDAGELEEYTCSL